MYCVIQEIQTKRPNKHGYSKKLISEYMKMSFRGKDMSHYYYYQSEEKFERSIKKAYKVSLHQSFREDGRVKKKQFCICTLNYYDIADGFYGIYDYCNTKVTEIASTLKIPEDEIYDLVDEKLNPLIEKIQTEFKESEEFITHMKNEEITTIYAAKKVKFNSKYGFDGTSTEYDKCYDVFGNLMNEAYLEKIKADYANRQEYEKKSRSYREDYYSNYNNSYSSGSYSNNISSNHNTEDKETLKQFYRVLSKKFHPDANPDTDTSKQMQLLNMLKDEWGV